MHLWCGTAALRRKLRRPFAGIRLIPETESDDSSSDWSLPSQVARDLAQRDFEGRSPA